MLPAVLGGVVSAVWRRVECRVHQIPKLSVASIVCCMPLARAMLCCTASGIPYPAAFPPQHVSVMHTVLCREVDFESTARQSATDEACVYKWSVALSSVGLVVCCQQRNERGCLIDQFAPVPLVGSRV
jgi:hypothetical protein